jgi:hypothetical protein
MDSRNREDVTERGCHDEGMIGRWSRQSYGRVAVESSLVLRSGGDSSSD